MVLALVHLYKTLNRGRYHDMILRISGRASIGGDFAQL
jgi:hypothetical protein